MINPKSNLNADPQKGDDEKVLSEKSLDDLRRSLAGTVVGLADAEYDAVRRCYNALVNRRPAVADTIQPATASVTVGS